jgi:tetratricopeptide (TPR) repeat protein
VVTPIIAALVALWTPGRWRKSEWALLAAWLAGAAIDALFTRINQPVDPMSLRGQPGLWFRPFVALDALAFDAGKLLWPMQLAIDYGRTPVHLMQSGQWKWTWIIPVIVAAVLVKLGRQSWICAGLFAVGVLPLLGLTPYRFQIYYGTVADRYLYPAMIGISLGAALAWSKLGVKYQRGVLPATAVLLVVYAAISFHQLSYWQDSRALFTRAIEVNPQSFAGYHNRGAVENHEDEYQAAEADFRKLIEIAPDAPEGYRGLARAQMALGHVDDALADWTKALEIEQKTMGQHGDMASDFKQELASNYAEAAAAAMAAGRTEQAHLWGTMADRASN